MSTFSKNFKSFAPAIRTARRVISAHEARHQKIDAMPSDQRGPQMAADKAWHDANRRRKKSGFGRVVRNVTRETGRVTKEAKRGGSRIGKETSRSASKFGAEVKRAPKNVQKQIGRILSGVKLIRFAIIGLVALLAFGLFKAVT